MIKEKKILLYMDLAYCFLILPLILVLIPTNKFIENDPYFFLILLIYMVTLYYINRRFNIPALIIKKEFLKAGVVFLSTIIIAWAFTKVPILDLRHADFASIPDPVDLLRALTVWFLYFINMSFGLMTSLVVELFRQIISRQEIESERNKAEIALYKSQINPHFMFNTLNTLYGLFITQSEKTEEVFIKFTDIIKYMYSNAEKEKIPIIDEVTYIREYIDIQSLRLGTSTSIDFSCEIDEHSLLIPPMILITFVENAFKYGISSTKDSIIHISILLKDNLLIFKTSNVIFNNRNYKSDGIGIENCRKRLNLLYSDRYTLDCGAEGDIFNTKLTIEL